jgi:hypothetical protein
MHIAGFTIKLINDVSPRQAGRSDDQDDWAGWLLWLGRASLLRSHVLSFGVVCFHAVKRTSGLSIYAQGLHVRSHNFVIVRFRR